MADLDTERFTKGYIEALVYIAPGEDHLHPGDMADTCAALAGFAPAEVRAAVEADAARFLEAHGELIAQHYDIEQAGADLAFTRNHHGTGYWDDHRLSKELGEALTKAAEAEGEKNLLVEDWEDTRTWAYE